MKNIILLSVFASILCGPLSIQAFPASGRTSPASDRVSSCNSLYVGTYTVGADGFFYDLREAFDSLSKYGMGGDVTLSMGSGIYSENIDFHNLLIDNNPYRIIITSRAGKADSVVFQPKSGSVVTLKARQKMEFREITLDASKTGTCCVEFGDSTRDITFIRCHLKGYRTTNVSEYQSTIYKGTYGTIHNIRFIGNEISGGSYAVYLYGASSVNRNANIVFDSNHITDYYRYAAYMFNNNNVKFVRNFVEEGKNVSGSNQGIYIFYTDTGNVSCNRIRTYGYAADTQIGIHCHMTDSLFLISNNEIIMKTLATGCGIQLERPSGTRVVNNSVFISGKSGGRHYGLSQNIHGETGDGYHCVVENNIFIVRGGNYAYPLYMDMVVTSRVDYNCLLGGRYLAFVGGVASGTLSSYRKSVPSAVHDTSLYPLFKDTLQSLELKAYSGLECPYDAEVTEDINGRERTAVTTMGCHADHAKNYNVRLVSFSGIPSVGYANDTLHPCVILENSGLDSVTSAKVRWECDGVVQGSDRVWNGALAIRGQDTLPLGNLVLKPGKHDFRVYLLSTGTEDSVQTDDTVACVTYTCSGLYAGTYTVGDKGYFKTLEDAIRELEACGMSASVVLRMLPGKYQLNLTIGNIPGASAINTLTLTSDSEDSSSVQLQGLNTAVNTSLLTLQESTGIIIRNLTLTNMNGYAVWLEGDCRNISIRNNHIQCASTSTIGGCIYLNNNIVIVDSLSIIGNELEGGSYGIYLHGKSVYPYPSVFIDSNEIVGQYMKAIDLDNVQAVSLSHNVCRSRSAYFGTSWYGMQVGNSHVMRVEGNRIEAARYPGDMPVYGMDFHDVNKLQEQDYALIANNEIKLANGSRGSAVGLNKGKIKFFNNSILMGSTGNGIALHCLPNGFPMELKGNLAVTYGSLHTPIYIVDYTNTCVQMDYNDYYGAGSCVGNFGGTKCSSLAEWQKASGQDAHSVSIEPVFMDTSKYLKLKTFVGLQMPRMNGVLQDIEGKSRDAITLMGAYGPTSVVLDAALDDFGKTQLTGGQRSKVEVTLCNYGKTELTSVSIGWKVNGVIQTACNWKGGLQTFGSVTVTLGEIVPKANDSIVITAWIASVNGRTDMEHGNDTISLGAYACVSAYSGTYTVGGVSPDFSSLQEAVNNLIHCGISAPVTLKVRNGKYGSLTISDTVPGTSAVNTVTVTADGTATVVLDGGSSVPSLALKNTAYWNFRNLTIGNTSDGLTGVQMEELLEHIHFHGCTLSASAVATDESCAAVSYKGRATSQYYPSGICFTANRVQGGHCNFRVEYLAGNSVGVSHVSMSIDSNVLSDACYAGVYASYFTRLSSLSCNTIRSRNAVSEYYGIWCQNYSVVDRMEANRIHICMDQTVKACGIRLENNMNLSSGDVMPGSVRNNEIMLKGAGGSVYGIYASKLNQTWEISHNSVLVSGTSDNYGLYLNSPNSSYKLNVLNNQVVCSEGKVCYPVYVSGNSYMSDYNNYVTAGSQSVGYAGKTCTSMAAWQLLTGQDAHSVSKVPSFADTARHLKLADCAGYYCPVLSTVPADIDGNRRNLITVMGAYEDTASEVVNLKVVGFISPQSVDGVACYENYTPVNVVIRNEGLRAADFSASPLKIILDVSGILKYHDETTISSGRLESMASDTLLLFSVPTLLDGTYRFKVTLSSTEDVLPGDDSLSVVYKVCRLTVPYDVDFTRTPAELVSAVSSGSVTWSVERGTGSNPMLAPAFGTGRLEFAGYGKPGASASAVFNGVGIRNYINPTLSFWYAHFSDCRYADELRVLLSTDGGASYVEVKRIPAKDQVTAWKQYDIDLKPYNKCNCLSIIFQAIGYGGANQSIDRIRISGQPGAPDSIDIQVSDVFTEKVSLNKRQLKPVVRLVNISEVDVSGVNVHVSALDSAGKVFATFGETQQRIRPGDTIDHVFSTYYITPDYNGRYTLKAFVDACDGDYVRSNDTLCKSFACEGGVGMAEAAADRWSMGQNQPNPAANVTRVPFTLPEAGTVIFNVMGLNGQVLYREEVSAEAGRNELQVNTSDYAAGIYYYSMEYKGQRLVRKMNIVR